MARVESKGPKRVGEGPKGGVVGDWGEDVQQ